MSRAVFLEVLARFKKGSKAMENLWEALGSPWEAPERFLEGPWEAVAVLRLVQVGSVVLVVEPNKIIFFI